MNDIDHKHSGELMKAMQERILNLEKERDRLKIENHNSNCGSMGCSGPPPDIRKKKFICKKCNHSWRDYWFLEDDESHCEKCWRPSCMVSYETQRVLSYRTSEREDKKLSKAEGDWDKPEIWGIRGETFQFKTISEMRKERGGDHENEGESDNE